MIEAPKAFGNGGTETKLSLDAEADASFTMSFTVIRAQTSTNQMSQAKEQVNKTLSAAILGWGGRGKFSGCSEKGPHTSRHWECAVLVLNVIVLGGLIFLLIPSLISYPDPSFPCLLFP